MWLMPERTSPVDTADRLEITPEDLLRPGIVQEVELLVEALRLFGGRMIRVKAG